MRWYWKNENIQITQESSNDFITYLTLFTEITSYKPVLQLKKTRIFPNWGAIYLRTSLCFWPVNHHS